jgi:protein-tyrosine phosphatase
VRADALSRLSDVGWAALHAHGVRTVVDLRNHDELGPDAAAGRAGLETVHVPLDGAEDAEFWAPWRSTPAFGTPLYYGPHLERFPERSARAVAAVAGARPGGVVVHCGIGRDRTGLVSALLLALAGVEPEAIADDYALSSPRVGLLLAELGEPDHVPEVEAFLAGEGTTGARLIVALLREVDVEATLRAGGLGDDDVAALRARLLEPGR